MAIPREYIYLAFYSALDEEGHKIDKDIFLGRYFCDMPKYAAEKVSCVLFKKYKETKYHVRLENCIDREKIFCFYIWKGKLIVFDCIVTGINNVDNYVGYISGPNPETVSKIVLHQYLSLITEIKDNMIDIKLTQTNKCPDKYPEVQGRFCINYDTSITRIMDIKLASSETEKDNLQTYYFGAKLKSPNLLNEKYYCDKEFYDIERIINIKKIICL